MRVLHVAATYHPATSYGGAVVSMHQLIQAQVALGATVRVLTTDADGSQRMPLTKANWGGAEVEYWPARPLNSYGVSPGLWRATLSQVRQHDIVHLHGVFLPSTTVGLWSCRSAGTASVVSPHGALMRWAVGRRPLRKRLYGILDRSALASSLLHAASDAEAADLRALGFHQVVVVPNGVDHEYLAQMTTVDLREHVGIRSSAPIVAWMGRFSEVKNLEVLVDATLGLGVELVLAGRANGTYGQTIRERVRQQGRSDVHFVGYVEGDFKRALLQQASVYAHPSLMESYGMSIVEALAAGCPVVASTGTPWAVLDERKGGRWVAPDANSFREAIEATLTGPRQEHRRAALALAAEHGWARRAQAMLEAYDAHRSGRAT